MGASPHPDRTGAEVGLGHRGGPEPESSGAPAKGRVALLGSGLVGGLGHVLDGDATSGARALYLREVHPEVLRLAFGGGRGLSLILVLTSFPGRASLAYHRLLLHKPSFYAFSRFRSGGGAFVSCTSSKQPDCERNYYECEQNANAQPHTFAVSSSFALGGCGSSESSRHALGTSFVAALTKFYSCLFQTLSGCNTSTPPASFWVRWQGCPTPPAAPLPRVSYFTEARIREILGTSALRSSPKF